MLTDPSKTILDKDQELTIYDDSYELAGILRTIIEEAELCDGHAYYLKEAAIHIETLFDNYKSLLFIHYSKNKGIAPPPEQKDRETIFVKDLDLPERMRNIISSIISNKEYPEITLLDIETARHLDPSHRDFGKLVRWISIPNFGEVSFERLKAIMNRHGYYIRKDHTT